MRLDCIGCDRLGLAGSPAVSANSDDTLFFSGLCKYTTPPRAAPEQLTGLADGAVAVTDQAVYILADGEAVTHWEVGDVVGISVWRSEGWIRMETADGDVLLAILGDADCEDFLVGFEGALPLPVESRDDLKEVAQADRYPPSLSAALGLGELRLLERTMSRLERERRERLDRERLEAEEDARAAREAKEALGRRIMADRQAVEDALQTRAQLLERQRRVAAEVEEALRRELPGVPRSDRCVCPAPVWWEGDWHGDPFALPEALLDRVKRNIDRKWGGTGERARRRWKGAAKLLAAGKRFGRATATEEKDKRIALLAGKQQGAGPSALVAALAPGAAANMQRRSEARQREQAMQEQLKTMEAWLVGAGDRRGRRRGGADGEGAAAAAVAATVILTHAAVSAVRPWCVACGAEAGVLQQFRCGSHWAHRHEGACAAERAAPVVSPVQDAPQQPVGSLKSCLRRRAAPQPSSAEKPQPQPPAPENDSVPRSGIRWVPVRDSRQRLIYLWHTATNDFVAASAVKSGGPK